MKANVGEALVEAPDEVEDEGLIRENLAEHAKISGHPLETPIVICNGYVTLGEAVELGIRVEGARLAIAKELCFYGNPGVACGEAACEDGLGKIFGDGPEVPRLHDAVHARTIWIGSGDRSDGEDVVLEGELADNEEELISPASVVAGDVEDDGDLTLDVLDTTACA